MRNHTETKALNNPIPVVIKKVIAVVRNFFLFSGIIVVVFIITNIKNDSFLDFLVLYFIQNYVSVNSHYGFYSPVYSFLEVYPAMLDRESRKIYFGVEVATEFLEIRDVLQNFIFVHD